MSKSETRRIPQVPIEPKTEKKQKRTLPDVRFAALGAGLLVLILLILTLLISVRMGERAPSGAFRYRQVETVQYPLKGMNAMAAHGKRLIVAADNGFTMYDPAGKPVGAVRHVFLEPLLLSGDRLAAVCDAGGSRLSVLDNAGRLVMDLHTEGMLLDADLSRGDALCFAELQPGYKTVLTVYDGKQNQIYRWYSASRYMNRCAVSENAELLCAAALEERDARFSCSIVFFETDLQTPLAEVPMGEQLIRDLLFLNAETVCVIGEETTVYMTPSGETLGSYDYSGTYLMEYSADGNGFTALVLNKYQEGSENTLVLLDETGAVLAERYLGEAVLSVSAAGELCAVQTPEHLYVYDQSLELRAVQDADASVIYPDGTAVLRQNGVGIRCVPE